jgi:hypothetical protein
MQNSRKRMEGVLGAGTVFLLILFLPISTQAASDKGDFVGRVFGALRSVVGRDLNGIALNGSILEGRLVVSVFLDDVSLDGETLSSVSLVKTKLKGIDQNGRRIKGRHMVGSVFGAVMDNGEYLSLRIEDVRATRKKGLRDVKRYLVTYETEETVEPLCGYDDLGDPVYAIPLQGSWNLAEGVPGGGSWNDDEGVFTFACEGYVVAKCVLAGYKPWRRALICSWDGGCEMTDLRNHHQTCTRLLRADYCGDGMPHTVDNVWVNLYDGLGVRVDAGEWTFEAEWSAGGATCMTSTRLPDVVPACFEYLATEDCGDPLHFYGGSLIFSEVGENENQ